MLDCTAFFPLPWWAILLAVFAAWVFFNAGRLSGYDEALAIFDHSAKPKENHRANEL